MKNSDYESEAAGSVKSATDYIKEVRGCLKNGQQKQAYALMLQASVLYDDHPLILSYYGWLRAVVDKKYHSGITACRRAFVLYKPADKYNAGVIYPLLHLNLGRACLAAGKKKEAVENFTKGLKHDPYYVELKKEMRRLGIRKEPSVPFISRSNLLNRFIGMLRSRSA